MVAESDDGIDHAWIYIGEFDSRNEVVSYLKSIGVSETLITSSTVGSGNGDGGTHWRIESNGSQGVVINNNTDGKKATAMNMSAFRITQNDVSFSIKKCVDGTSQVVGKSAVDGSFAKYGVYSDSACKTKVGEIAIGENGTGSIKLPLGTYYVKEISAPTGYELSTKVYELKSNQTVTVYEKFQTGKIKINKTSEDNIVKDIEFEVTGSNGSSYTKKTDSKGFAEFSALNVYDMKTGKAVTYTVSEINVATRYKVPKAQNITLTSGDADLTVNVNFINDLVKGSIKINKQSEDNQNGDREFVITGNGKTYSIKTNSTGVAILNDISVFDKNNNKIIYTISEKNVPIKYVVPADQKVTLTADATTNVTFKNDLKKFTAEVVKKDSETVESQGDATLAGAVYGLYLDGELVDTYTTDSDGYFKTKEYVCGNYTIQEITPSEGYLLDETVYSVGAEPKNYTIENNSVSIDVTEDVVKGKITILKHSDDGATQIETPEEGAEFEVYLKSAGSFDAANEYEKDYLVCDENGYSATKMLPYGVYTVHQTKGWDGTELMADFDVTINENNKTYTFLINNREFESYVKVVKIDSETGNVIPYEGAGFEIYDAGGNRISMSYSYPTPTTIDVFYTNSEGYLITPEVLPYGEYTLVEIQAPYGYVLDSTPVAFTVSAENAEEENALTIIKVNKENTAQKGKISVQKSGDTFASVVMASSSCTNEKGEMTVNPTTYTPIFEEKGLANAVFEIVAAEDIVTADGTVRANAGNIVAELVTDENGYAETDLLYLGKYEITEVSAPYGYVKNPEIQAVELTYAGQEVTVRDTVNTSFVNDYQGVEISLEKVMESDELFGISAENCYQNVRFGLFADEEIVVADGTSIPENGLIAEVTLDENMKAVIAEKVPFGRYYVQEISTDEGISGTQTKKRTEFNRMIRLCKQKKIDLILCKSTSRFARNTVDCLENVRLLKSLGIGVIFEKENVNTLTMTSEFMIALYGSFAQAESESISKNVSLGVQMSFREGKIRYQYKNWLGYQKGADGKPEIVPNEAETVRIIFEKFLDGYSSGDIVKLLNETGRPTVHGRLDWRSDGILRILRNEKYAGDCLLQKTYTIDCISHKTVKNNGERAMYLVTGAHPAIINRDTFNLVQ